jgi:hypothetical protein
MESEAGGRGKAHSKSKKRRKKKGGGEQKVGRLYRTSTKSRGKHVHREVLVSQSLNCLLAFLLFVFLVAPVFVWYLFNPVLL